MKSDFIYELNKHDRIKITVDGMMYINDDLDIVEYSGVLTGEVIGIEDNIDYNGMSGIYMEYEEDISLAPKVIYIHYTEIASIQKIGIS